MLTAVKYPCRSGENELTVNSGDPEVVELMATEDGVILGRDSVAALVGQLSSWLRRTEGKE